MESRNEQRKEYRSTGKNYLDQLDSEEKFARAYHYYLEKQMNHKFDKLDLYMGVLLALINQLTVFLQILSNCQQYLPSETINNWWCQDCGYGLYSGCQPSSSLNTRKRSTPFLDKQMTLFYTLEGLKVQEIQFQGQKFPFMYLQRTRKADFSISLILDQAILQLGCCCLISKSFIVIIILSMQAGYWNKYSVELDRIYKTLNDTEIDARTIDIDKYFIRNEEFDRRFKTMSYNGDLKSQDVLKFFKLNMSNKLRFIFLLATHKQHRLKKFARQTLGQYILALMETIQASQLKGGLTLSKCVTNLVNFYKKCSFSLAEAPFSSWAERGTKMMCFELTMEEDDNEEERIPESAVKQKIAAVKQTVDKKQAVAKKIRKPLREKSAFDYDISSLLSDDDDVGLAPAKKQKPVQIDTSTIKVAATIKQVTKTRVKPLPKTSTTAIMTSKNVIDGDTDYEEVMSDEKSVKSKITTKPSNGCLNKHCIAGDCGGKLIKGNNWYVHNERKHRPILKPLPVKYYKCTVCEEERRYDRFPAKNRSVCVFCLDGKSCRGSVKGLEKGRQNVYKRQKTAVHMAVIEQAHDEVDVVRQLKAIETNTKSVYINASVIQDICSKFNKDLVIDFFSKGHTSWVRAIVTLSQMELTLRTETLSQFKFQIAKRYDSRIGIWCSTYWNYIEEDQFALLKSLMNSPSAVDDSVLMVSLCSQVGGDVEEYINVISAFTQSYVTAIHSIRDILLQISVAKWQEQIELAHATSTVIDCDTIQKSLDEFIAKYWKPDPKFATDLSLAGDIRFQFFTKVVLNPPNNKQFALAQYCLGLLRTHNRQMWCVPSGQGKGRIEHTLAVFALMLGFSKVYIFYPSKQLCDRDANEFSTYLDFVEKDQIQHCIGIDGVVVRDNELAIFDEGDAIMHSDPEKFRDFISKCLCVCFTATPDDQDSRDVDIQVLKAMTFPTFYYLPAMPVTEKAAEVKKLSQTGPVVIHCTTTLYDELKKLDLELIEADENVNHQILRTLGLKVNEKFRVVVALTTASMRGLDYRSSVDGIIISLLIAKSFLNKREAIQGFYRVGRFGDKCYRVSFKDVDLIDAKAELTYKLNAFKFLQALSRKTIQMKQINATDLTGQNKKTPAATGKTTPTRQDKNPTTRQIKTSYQWSMGRKRTNALVPQLLEKKKEHIEQAQQPFE
ncbi:UNKNOWN [Stylonychia lemnae]|uniref:Helicase ATP-binding domain-containing protein n=1 Tax=Stylonychia lemnae TaxID=5949 RepID=A0A078B486_STYLE|nr:UNKNOWN [Stylonychia lemnae]|eukprot:CDW88318.1 UNKNOWN [Stylonychia lemnae]